MGEKLYQHLRAFSDTFKFGQQQKTAETFDKDPEDFCKIKIGWPVNVNNDIAGHHTRNEADVSYPVPEYGVPVMNKGSQDAQGNAVEAVYHDFLDSRCQEKFVDVKSGGDENP